MEQRTLVEPVFGIGNKIINGLGSDVRAQSHLNGTFAGFNNHLGQLILLPFCRQAVADTQHEGYR